MPARQLLNVVYAIVAGDGSDFDELENKLLPPLDIESPEAAEERKMKFLAMGADIG